MCGEVNLKSDDDWRAHDDLHMLERAEEVRTDKKRFGAARKFATRKIAGLKRISRATGGRR